MWRNSLSFSSKLLTSSNPNCKSASLLSSISTANNGVERLLSIPRFFSSGATSPSSTEAVKLMLPKVDAIRSSRFASSAAAIIDAPSLAAAPLTLKPRWEVVDFARHYGRCYWELSKARLSMLVVATSGAGYVLGSGSAIDYVGLCCTCAGTMMVSASANSLNQVFEINNDAKMKRTMLRPLPSGRITRPHAIGWAASAGAAGTALLAYQTNALAAGLAASNLVLYAFVYTPLKQIHPVNTWVGAIVGAIPPLLGWVAASGHISLNAMVLPAALYFWQIPHFMALAYLCRADYAAGGFRMFSLADASGRRTALVSLRNCLYLTPLGYIAYDWGITSGWFCLESTILALAIAATSLSFYLNRTTKNARRMFHASLLYLPVFMSGLLLHRIPNDQKLQAEETRAVLDGISSSSETLDEEENKTMSREKEFKRAAGVGVRKQAPVAYASIAPFPFLPAPLMPNPDVAL